MYRLRTRNWHDSTAGGDSFSLADGSGAAMILLVTTPLVGTMREASMSTSKVISFGENTSKMTYAEGLAFIERTRRQLDRSSVALPQVDGRAIASEDAGAIRRQLNELEADLRRDLGHR